MAKGYIRQSMEEIMLMEPEVTETLTVSVTALPIGTL